MPYKWIEPDDETTPVKAASNLPYIVAVVIMVMIGVLSVVLITYLRPDKDNSTLIATVLGFILPTTTALLAFMKSAETHSAVNGRLDQFIAATKLQSDLELKIARLETQKAMEISKVTEPPKAL